MPVDEEESPADEGEEEVERRKLMGSRRLAEAKDKLVKKAKATRTLTRSLARDKERLLGSRRLRTVRLESSDANSL